MINFLSDCWINGNGIIRTTMAIILVALFFGWALAQSIVGGL